MRMYRTFLLLAMVVFGGFVFCGVVWVCGGCCFGGVCVVVRVSCRVGG